MDDMICRDFSEKLVLYHYGELSREQASEVAAHVLSCASCRKELDDISYMLSNVPGPEKINPGEAYSAARGVMRRLFRRPSAFRRLMPVYLTVAAAIAAVFIAVYLPGFEAPQPKQAQVAKAPAQADWEVLNNMDVINDLDVIHQINQSGLDELGPIRESRKPRIKRSSSVADRGPVKAGISADGGRPELAEANNGG
ncbi:MAG: anti-sigma factor family protein [Nitrospirota bacterium]